METIDHPAHYQGCSSFTRDIVLQFVALEDLDCECIDVIERWKFGFHLGSTIKYLWRCGQKGDPVEDLQKAKWYLERCQALYGSIWSVEVRLIDLKILELGASND